MPHLHSIGMRATRAPRLSYALHSRVQPRCAYSSGSPTASSIPQDQFSKTGQKGTSMGSDENSKSGGDDMVAEQAIASFEKGGTTAPAASKIIAGKGNVINPLEVSPASPEVSATVEDKVIESSGDRDPNAKSGPGVTRKSKRVEKKEIDFRPK